MVGCGMDRVGIRSGSEIFIWCKFSTFTSASVYEHAHMPLDLFGSVWDRFGSDLFMYSFGLDRFGIWSGPEIFIYSKFSTFTSASVYEHAHMHSGLVGSVRDRLVFN